MVDRLLTERQGEVLRQLCAGRNEREIATLYKISTHVVNQHHKRIRQRLGKRPLAEICRMAASGEAPPTLFRRLTAPRVPDDA
jgi:FixJ family two-component response regulator